MEFRMRQYRTFFYYEDTFRVAGLSCDIGEKQPLHMISNDTLAVGLAVQKADVHLRYSMPLECRGQNACRVAGFRGELTASSTRNPLDLMHREQHSEEQNMHCTEPRQHFLVHDAHAACTRLGGCFGVRHRGHDTVSARYLIRQPSFVQRMSPFSSGVQ